jgi:hypothetical protein
MLGEIGPEVIRQTVQQNFGRLFKMTPGSWKRSLNCYGATELSRIIYVFVIK